MDEIGAESIAEMTERRNLCGQRAKKLIDMEKVYRQLDNGRSVKDVAKEWGVSESTLRRRHREYQERIKILKKLEQERKEELPPLPPDMI